MKISKGLNMADEGEKIKLFDSDVEEVDEENDDFRIRPQYQGPHGQEMLEMSSQLSKRFKLDERFAEDFESEDVKKDSAENFSGEIEEKKKNLRILETVLGHEVNTKSADNKFSRKRLIRFDPDDENASKFIRTPIAKNTTEKPKKSKKKKEVIEEKPEDVVPISKERYIEVCPNLKEILNTSTPFSFSQKFSCDGEEANVDSQNETFPKIVEEVEIQEFEKKKENQLVTQAQKSSSDSFAPKLKYTFFITEGDPRLKEGIEFFKRPKPLEVIREEWQKRRESVLELFRRKRRTSQRSRSTRVQSVQMKNMIRKNNFKKQM